LDAGASHMHSHAKRGNENTRIISSAYQDVYNDKRKAWEREGNENRNESNLTNSWGM
ncbi:hypothetical protein MHK_005350, partial [Candidatus Magnetomorum sp. HK-1]